MKINRIITIIMVLLQREKISGKELAEKLNVSLRTIYRDIQVIEGAGIPIITYQGSAGGISILKNYKISKGLFTKEDVIVLLKGLNLLSSPVLKESENLRTLEKIKSFLSEQELDEVTNNLNQLIVDLSPWFSKQNIDNKISIIRLALKEQLLLSFDYLSIRNKQATRLIEPYKLIFKEKEWYLQAFCLTKNDFRVFKLSKMSNIRKTNTKFIRQTTPKAFSLFQTEMKKKIFKIKLLIDESLLERILNFCDEKDIKKLNEQQYLVNFDFIDDDYSYGILLSLGHQCICLEPEHIRHELVERAEKIIKSYKKSVNSLMSNYSIK
ncbi:MULTISPECIES: helix-turn-helix transcriptional regulator [unclassified Gilliamella]|uniref:helix-turn-helix transcriptional regulator n=1 Tax=unclassified Gilliamella TaxID=2685620 RepID=UPI00226AF9E0|nr:MULTISPECIES: YafY family protein [unclassified Gilliamella]MCX8574879.1 YafY family transcriptional regulator [Gilliamella sp. B3831]MCX8577133.1 YafY family transcriptional regulator [Gilliamella sp. B3815]MCX8589605.1 YafY family transcriptional regulator [Gilliamella sp. B3812]MCX8604179.1 YafY family transcriptional regulator [Gilliamella sp. B3823]MCX8605499.1 YafY family transcriptional regulator [Gilliamella sp. B3825]